MLILHCRRLALVTTHCQTCRLFASVAKQPVSAEERTPTVSVGGRTFVRDEWTNVTPKILSLVGQNLHLKQHHPLNLLKLRITDFFHKHYRKHPGSPLFSVQDTLHPAVTLAQNFDSLLVPADHVSRSHLDTYYVNSATLLRSHTSAHQAELIRSGLDAFLVFGDVYRRDEIDSTHYPAFHQMEGVRLYSGHQLFREARDPSHSLCLFDEDGGKESQRPPDRQERHTLETAKVVEFELKTALQDLAKSLFGSSVEYRWVDAFFPFTHPSWELELHVKGVWTEMLGCGIIEQRLLDLAGAPHKVGYAFGLGLERWAMRLYGIPDIRLFWSRDEGFLQQFRVDSAHQDIVYKAVSVYPPCVMDLSFWLPEQPDADRFQEKELFDLIRSVAGDLVEQVRLQDRFVHPKSGRQSHCYRIVYRDHHRTLTTEEVNRIHASISESARQTFGVQIR